MGTNLPTKPLEALGWVESHLGIWQNMADPSNIGLTAEQIAELATFASAARAAYEETVTIRTASKLATQTWQDSASAMMTDAGSLISAIKGYARAVGGTSVYELAQVEAPEPPSEKPAPPTPTDVKAQVVSDGSVMVTWKNREAEGAVYPLYRRLNGAGTFELIDTVSGEKEYRDNNIAPGTTQASYRVVALRNGRASLPSNEITVRFGIAGDSSAGAGALAESA